MDTIRGQLEKIVEEFCDNYCHKLWELNQEGEQDDETMDRFYNEVCGNCPVNRI